MAGIEQLIERAIAEAYECSGEHRDYRLEKAVKAVMGIVLRNEDEQQREIPVNTDAERLLNAFHEHIKTIPLGS